MIHKVLSVKQPLAYLICSGIKDIENRTWKLPEKYKNEWVLIHASADKKLDLSVLTEEQMQEAYLELTGTRRFPKLPVKKWTRSAIIGAVKYSDCVINNPSIWAEKTDNLDMVMFGFKKIYNWVVSEAILFDKPILNVKGKLGFWDYDLEEECDKLKQKQALIDTMRGDE
jgi:hypothetical protein